MGVSINMMYDNFSSCESDIHSSIDSDDSDATYIKVSDIEEINKNLKKKQCKLKISRKNVHGEKKNYDEYENSQRYLEESEHGKTSKGYYKNNSMMSSRGKVDKLLMENNVNNFKFIYNFIHDIKNRIKFIDIYNGSDFVISINNFGHVYAWGNNKYGCLGTGDTINRYVPTLIDPGYFFLYDFEKLQIHTSYKTEISIKVQNNIKESFIKCNEADCRSVNSNNFVSPNKHFKDDLLVTLKTDNIYTSEHMLNFENINVDNVTISVQKIYVPISSIFCDSDSDNNYKIKKNEKRESKKSKTNDFLSSSSSEEYYLNLLDRKKLESMKNRYNKNKILFCKKKISFSVKNPMQNYYNITNDEIFLNNRKLKLCSNLNATNKIKKKKVNNNLVLIPIQVCVFNLSYRNSNYDFNSFPTGQNNDRHIKNENINKNSEGNVSTQNSKLKNSSTTTTNNNNNNNSDYTRVYDFLESFIKGEIVNMYMNIFRNDINIYTNIPNNININPYIYGMNFYDYNFYNEKYKNFQNYLGEGRNENEFNANNNAQRIHIFLQMKIIINIKMTL
ncbi:conserved Plasmodium membrane protein, unknown function [Plasmodium sp. DRC-Itaito]|nr:conserved Plasmodium membrane protein, unknown function [Plasmodium sp. DRC-Itaito]